MKAMVMPVQNNPKRKAALSQRMQIVVNIQAEVLDSELARRKANVWLLENAGNLLGAENPELLLGDRLLWRYDVILGQPNLDQPGTGNLYRIGQIILDAVTGEVQNTEALIKELQVHAAAITR
jgi:hypothetical protein